VKGKTNPITIYELIATADQRIPADKQQVLDLYTRGLQHYKQRDWATALDHMQRAYDLDPHNRPAALYIQRAQAYLQHPPPASWDGIFQMTTK
jgi:adenylate cyclase